MRSLRVWRERGETVLSLVVRTRRRRRRHHFATAQVERVVRAKREGRRILWGAQRRAETSKPSAPMPAGEARGSRGAAAALTPQQMLKAAAQG